MLSSTLPIWEPAKHMHVKEMLCLLCSGEVPTYSIFLLGVVNGTLPAKEMVKHVHQAISANCHELDSKLFDNLLWVRSSSCQLLFASSTSFPSSPALPPSKAPVTPPCLAFLIDFISEKNVFKIYPFNCIQNHPNLVWGAFHLQSNL